MRTNYKFLIILAILLASSIIISVFAHFHTRFPGDLWLAQGVQSVSSDFLTSMMQGITFIFDTWGSFVMVAVIALLVWWRTGWQEAIIILAGGLLSATSAVF